MSEALLDMNGLEVRFGSTIAVRDVGLHVLPGEAVGLVGESGSGKSTAMLAVLGLHPPGSAAVTARRLRLAGHDILAVPERTLRDLRGRVAAMIFQDPLTALNPVMPIGSQIAEVLVRHHRLGRSAAMMQASALLETVGIADGAGRLRDYPMAFSGGMRQRVMIAIALAGQPRLLIADEPTTALDVTVQAELVRLIRGLQRERGMGLVWVTHDLALMAGVVDRVVVLYAGRVMESAPVDLLYARPLHPYTVALLESLPRFEAGPPRVRAHATRDVAPAAEGCPFAPRCPHRFARCAQMPPLFEDRGSLAACWLLAR
nr:ABC transporter ATP-binding protein [uncultured Lichenicoccus sp.]